MTKKLHCTLSCLIAEGLGVGGGVERESNKMHHENYQGFLNSGVGGEGWGGGGVGGVGREEGYFLVIVL